MVHFSNAELVWMASELRSTAEQYDALSKCGVDVTTSVLAKIRAEQMETIVKKLDEALEAQDKRIAIDWKG